MTESSWSSLDVLESKHVITTILYIRAYGPCRKIDIYRDVSRNANMVQRLKELESLGIIGIDCSSGMSKIDLTDKGRNIADLLDIVSRAL